MASWKAPRSPDWAPRRLPEPGSRLKQEMLAFLRMPMRLPERASTEPRPVMHSYHFAFGRCRR